MTPQQQCPHCGVSLQGAAIPEQHLHYYGGETHYRREIGVEMPCYDGCLFWQCPDCGGRWHRFPEGHYLRARATEYVQAPGAEPDRAATPTDKEAA